MEIIQKNNDENNNLLKHISFRYLPYWPLFLTLFVLAGASAWLYLQTATPIYQASARILIDDEKKGAEESKAIESLDIISQNKIIENETEVIQSRTIVNQVVNNLALYAPVFQEKFLRNIPAYSFSPVTVSAKNPEKLTSVKKIPFSFYPKDSSVIISGIHYSLNNWVNTKFGILKFSSNPYYTDSQNTEKLFFSLMRPKDAVDNLIASINVSSTSKESSILDVTLKDEVPDRAKDALNELMNVYTASSVQDKNLLGQNTLKFLDARLANVSHGLDTIEKKVQQYKTAKGATDISTQGKLYLENVSNNDQKLGDIDMQIAVLNEVQHYAESKDNTEGIVPSTNDPVLSQLVNKLYSAEIDYENLKKTSGLNNPLTITAKDQVDKLRPSIIENIQSQKNNLITSRNNLSSTNNSFSSVLQAIPEKEKQLIDINRDQNIKSETYNFLLQKREETALALASTTSDSKIIDAADASDKPVSPKKTLAYLSAVLAALFIGIIIVYIKEMMTRTIMFRREIETLTIQPIVGEIAAETSKNPVVIGMNQRTFIAEQFRKLRITLNYLGINSVKNKRILITSSISGEGKSFIALNLALSLAMTGKKVILLDFDLNNPSLNNKLNIDKSKGITDFLIDDVDPEEIIQQTDLNKNLFLMPTGQLPQNPSELMMNGKVSELLDYLDNMFDYIVIDTAPVTPVTDAYILAPYCDATLYIIRHGYTPKALVERIDENNKINNLKNTAIVFNSVKPRGFGNKNYGYGYGYSSNYKQDQRKRLTL